MVRPVPALSDELTPLPGPMAIRACGNPSPSGVLKVLTCHDEFAERRPGGSAMTSVEWPLLPSVPMQWFFQGCWDFTLWNPVRELPTT